MKRQVCSYDMVVVPSGSYTVTDAEGDIYLCNSRCLCLWAVQFVTKVERREEDKAVAVEMRTPHGTKSRFSYLLDLAQWAAANALSGANNEWMKNGEEVSWPAQIVLAL